MRPNPQTCVPAPLAPGFLPPLPGGVGRRDRCRYRWAASLATAVAAPQLPHGLNAGGCSGSEVHFIRSGWCLSEGLACQVAASRTPWPMRPNRFGVFGISVKVPYTLDAPTGTVVRMDGMQSFSREASWPAAT